MSNRHYRGVVAAIATLLATAPLTVLFEGMGWLLHCVVVIALVAAAAATARILRGGVWIQATAMVTALLLALTWLFSSGHEILGVLPGSGTVAHFQALLIALPDDMRTSTIPVPELDSLLLITAAGVGLVAILVDLFTVGLRRPALAGLPMLVIYSVPVSVMRDSVPMLLFAIGAIGYLWLLGSDNLDRVRRFGRRLTGDGRDVEAWEPSPLAAAGRRLAVIGVLVAVALPLTVPGMSSGIVDRFGPSMGPGAGPGGSGTGQVNLFAELYGQLNHDDTVELLQVTTEDPDPYYLRLATADQITDLGFEPSSPDGLAVPEISPRVRTEITYERHQAEIELTDAYAMALAPTYTLLQRVDGLDHDWMYDPDQQVVYSRNGDATPPTYEFTYQRPEFDPDTLRRAQPLPAANQFQQNFAHAPEIPEVRQLLDTLVDPTDVPYDQVRDILDFFSRENGFRYDLTTGPETDAPAIVDFLENRSGFCVQYAAAMAWLVRGIEMPARVAFGFTRGRADDSDTRTLTNRNLHAWTEVYFDRFGWVPFDPTPGTAVSGSTSRGWAPNPQAPPETDPTDSSNGPNDSTPASPGANAEEEDLFPDINGGTGLGPRAGDGDSGVPWWAVGTIVAAIVLLAQPALHRGLLRRHRTGPRTTAPATAVDTNAVVVGQDESAAARKRAHQIWAELQDTLVDLKMTVDSTETPRVTTQRLYEYVQADGEAAKAVQLLGQAEERARYARTTLPSETLGAALDTTRRALAQLALPRVRVRAVLVPPSTLQRWRTATIDALTRLMSTLNGLGYALGRFSPRRLLRSAPR